MRIMTRLITVLAVLLAGVAPTPAAAAARCSLPDGGRGVHVWIKSPTTRAPDGSPGGRTRPAGTRLCRALPSGAPPVLYVEGATGNILVTRRAPTAGGPAGSPGRGHADAAERLAARYGVTLQLAARDEGGRRGYVRASKALITGSYSPGGALAPGEGLIRLGNGGGNMSVAGSGNNWFRRYLLNAARHEIAHAEIEQRCGTTAPPVAGGRTAVRSWTGKPVREHVTDAYARLYLGATTTHAGGYGYSKAWDVPRARAIHAGRCG
jgi:hypothetical protein